MGNVPSSKGSIFSVILLFMGQRVFRVSLVGKKGETEDPIGGGALYVKYAYYTWGGVTKGGSTLTSVDSRGIFGLYEFAWFCKF